MSKNQWLTYLEIFLIVICLMIILIASVHEQVVFVPLILVVILNLIQRQQLIRWYDTNIEQILNTVNDKISVKQLDYLNQDFQRSLDELESINIQETSRLEEALSTCVKRIKMTRKELMESVKNQLTEVNKVVDKLKNNEVNPVDKSDSNKIIQYFLTKFFRSEFEEIKEQLVSVKSQYEDQKIDLINVMSQKYQGYIANIKELLMPITERQDYLENTYSIIQNKMEMEMRELDINLSQNKQQQEEYFAYFNRIIGTPLERENLYLDKSQEVSESIVKIQELEKNIQIEFNLKEQKIDELMELFKEHQQKLDNIIQNDITQNTEAIEYIYLSIAKINHFVINYEQKYNQLEKISNAFRKKFAKRLNELYNYQIKPLKNYVETIDEAIKNINENCERIEGISNLKTIEIQPKITKIDN